MYFARFLDFHLCKREKCKSKNIQFDIYINKGDTQPGVKTVEVFDAGQWILKPDLESGIVSPSAIEIRYGILILI